jgi:DNA-binding NarL/FixJ family response regulator
MKAKPTVLIVDDHPVFRQGVRSIIERSGRYAVAGEASTGAEAVRLGIELEPDLVLLDLSLPDQSGTETCRELKRALPRTAVVILSMHCRTTQIIEAVKAGASGYVTKETAAERVVQALDAASKGEHYLDGRLSGSVLQRLARDGPRPGQAADGTYETLTPREQEIMAMLADGQTPGQIAAKLHISVKTVENHRSNIMRKLGLHGAHELIRAAARLGLIDLELWAR